MEGTNETTRNESEAELKLMTLLDAYIDELKDNRMYGQLEKGPLTWTYWGALFFCGTVVTTVGRFNFCYFELSILVLTAIAKGFRQAMHVLGSLRKAPRSLA